MDAVAPFLAPLAGAAQSCICWAWLASVPVQRAPGFP
jgi:hypothetical protein